MSGDDKAPKNPIEEAVEQVLDAFVYAPIGLLLDGPARFPKLVRNGRSQVTNARMMGEFTVKMGRAEVEKRARDVDGPLADVLRSFGLAPERPAPTATDAPTGSAVAAAKASDAAAAATGTDAPTTSAAADAPATTASTTRTPAKKTPAKKTPAKKTPAKKTSARKASTKKTSARTSSAKKTAAKKAAKKTTPATRTAAPASLPIPEYDSLSASQVVSRLRGLEPAQLEAVRAYEQASRGRKTVLSKIQQLTSS